MMEAREGGRETLTSDKERWKETQSGEGRRGGGELVNYSALWLLCRGSLGGGEVVVGV